MLWQPARGHGYRTNLDPVLLAGFVLPARRVLDLGAGCGVVGLLLLKMGKALEVTAVEVQPELAELAAKNVVDNRLEAAMQVRTGDLRTLDLGVFDAVVFNPPYFRAAHGRRPPEPGRATGRYETHGTLADFISAGMRALDLRGRMSAIVPTARLGEVRRALAADDAGLERVRPVCSRAGSASRLAVWQAARQRASAREVTSEAPIVVHAGVGREYAAEVRGWLRE